MFRVPVFRLVSGADISSLDKFDPDYFPPELIFFFFGLCITFEDLEDEERGAKCKEVTRCLYGIVSGLGYEATQISYFLERFRKGIDGR